MFGHDDQQADAATEQTVAPTTPMAPPEPTDQVSPDPTASPLIQPDQDDNATATDTEPMIKPDVDATLPQPTLPQVQDDSAAAEPVEADTDDTAAPVPDFPEPELPATDEVESTPSDTENLLPSTATPDAVPPSADNGEALLGIKQEALTQLSPLVDHLDQTPEEKFHTTMMMIQASDDQSLIPQAFEAAKQITDDKARAQALLDIINEINYFTQHQSATNAPA